MNTFGIFFAIFVGIGSLVLGVLYYIQEGASIESVIVILFGFIPFLFALILKRKNKRDY